MKRITAIFLSLLMVLSVSSTAFGAITWLDTNVSFDVTSGGEHTITVSTGDEITVTFTVNNITNPGEAFPVQTLVSKIYYDDDFFQLDESSITKTFGEYNLDVRDDSAHDWYVCHNGFHNPTINFEDGQIIGTFKLKVLAASGSSTLSFAEKVLAYGDYYPVTGNDLTVFIGEKPPTLYNVTYMHNDAVYKTSQMTGKISIDSIPSPAPANHKFLGWEYNGQLYQPGDEFEVTEDVTFTSKWEENIQVLNYSLTFDTNGGTQIAEVTAESGTDIDLGSYTTTKTGYVFEGWYSDEGLTNKITSIKLDGNKTVYANWVEATKPTYTLTFNTNGGSNCSPLTKEEGTVIDLSAYKPTKSGYTFKGWYKDSALTQAVTSITLTANTTLYAKWEVKSTGGGGGGGAATTTKYTLTFNTDGGSKIDSLEAKEGTKVTLDKYVSEKSGYKFDGWYSDKELTQKVTEVTINKDMTVYVKWVVSDDEPVVVKPDYKPGILTDEHYAYIVGREGGMIEPESDITRAEVATIIYRLLDEDERNNAKTKENVFTDVNEDDWFNTAVSTLASLELVKGRTTDTFAPNVFITRAELATIFARMVKVEYGDKELFSDISGHWAESYINEAATAEWIVGYNGLFRPDDNITRAEVMTFVNRVLNREPESKADLIEGMTTWKDNANENAWYYLAVQEAANSHTYEMKADGKHEKWTSLTENPNWSKIED